MIDLPTLVRDFARGVKAADARGPQAVSRSGRVYRPGLGPHTESRSVRLILDELTALDPYYAAHQENVPYGPGSRQRCDLCLGTAPAWDWAVEIKLLRLFGDNGSLNDNMLTHVLSPYAQHRSALTDCAKLVQSSLDGDKAVLILAYENEQWPIEPAIRAFEVLAADRVRLGPRHEVTFDGLTHPVHRSGAVVAWQVARRGAQSAEPPAALNV